MCVTQQIFISIHLVMQATKNIKVLHVMVARWNQFASATATSQWFFLTEPSRYVAWWDKKSRFKIVDSSLKEKSTKNEVSDSNKYSKSH